MKYDAKHMPYTNNVNILIILNSFQNILRILCTYAQ
jgi:hypothetical protein